MISAMPAVALRRAAERKVPPAKVGKNGKAVQPPALIDYYHNKISRLSSLPPTRRTYSTSTSLQSPDNESGNFPYDEDAVPLTGCRRLCRRITLFHVGCFFLASGLIMLFVSVASIKISDLTPIRAVGSSLIVFGALLCLIRTVCFQRNDHILLPMGTRSDSFVTRPSRSPTSPMSPDPFPPTTPLTPLHEEDPAPNGGITTGISGVEEVEAGPNNPEAEGLLDSNRINVEFTSERQPKTRELNVKV